MTLARGVRPPDIDLSTETDPFRHLVYLGSCVDVIRTALLALDERSSWRHELAIDPRVRELVLDEIAVSRDTLTQLAALIEPPDPVVELLERLAEDRIELVALRALIAERVGARAAA